MAAGGAFFTGSAAAGRQRGLHRTTPLYAIPRKAQCKLPMYMYTTDSEYTVLFTPRFLCLYERKFT